MELDLAERTITPYARSGVLVTFAARRNDGATLRIVTREGEPMPLGSEVRIALALRRMEVANDVESRPGGRRRRRRAGGSEAEQGQSEQAEQNRHDSPFYPFERAHPE